MDSNTSGIFHGKHGAPLTTVTQYQSWLCVHPDHVGFVIGAKGATVKKIASDCRCYVRIQDPNAFSKGFPWFIIKGDVQSGVCEAYHRLRTIANEADRRLPRMGTQNGPAPRPKAKLNVKEQEVEPAVTPEEPKEVTVTKMTDNEGNERLVDPKTHEVYDEDGRLIGHWKDGFVMARADASE